MVGKGLERAALQGDLSLPSRYTKGFPKSFLHKDETQFPRHMNRWEPVGRVARVIVYPVKSLAGVQVQLVNFYLFCL